MEVEVEVENETSFLRGTPVHCTNGSITQSSRVCDVCLLPFDPSTFVTFDECGHSFCSACVSLTYESCIKNCNTSLTCLECKYQASPGIVRDNVSTELYHRYLDFSLRQYLAVQPNVRQCMAPDCPFAYIVDNPSSCEDNHFVCQRNGCGTEYCVSCKGAWHEGLTCKKARKMRKQKVSG